ncbi:MAG: hypothetical protein E7Z85_00100 [Methanosphaera stadtmanae]|nr:hypothetical protein [Methanosphaera stadtmanae]
MFIPRIWLSIININVMTLIMTNNIEYNLVSCLSTVLGVYEKSLYREIIIKIILNNNEKFTKFTKYLNARK